MINLGGKKIFRFDNKSKIHMSSRNLKYGPNLNLDFLIILTSSHVQYGLAKVEGSKMIAYPTYPLLLGCEARN